MDTHTLGWLYISSATAEFNKKRAVLLKCELLWKGIGFSSKWLAIPLSTNWTNVQINVHKGEYLTLHTASYFCAGQW